ncbi:hypothetical protein [Phenylobacterium sp.]
MADRPDAPAVKQAVMLSSLDWTQSRLAPARNSNATRAKRKMHAKNEY